VHVNPFTNGDRDAPAEDHECGGITTPGGPETLKLTTRSLPEGAIKPVIHATFALAEAAKAHVLMESGESFGKVVLVT
jgi:NADPH:quinone reductase-like Zn-dependent oxidoreductase